MAGATGELRCGGTRTRTLSLSRDGLLLFLYVFRLTSWEHAWVRVNEERIADVRTPGAAGDRRMSAGCWSAVRCKIPGAERGEAPESTPCPTLTTHPVSLKALPLVLDTYEAAVRVCRGLSAQGV